MRKVAVLGLVLFGLLAASAQARPFEEAEEVAYAQALAYWGSTPTMCGEIVKSVEPLANLDAGGEATEPTAFQPVCFLRIDPTIAEYPGWLCADMTHEVGHLLGYGHNSDPTSIMHPPALLSAVPHCLELEEAHSEAVYVEEVRRHKAHCRKLASIQPRTRRLRKRVEWCRAQAP